MDAATRRVPRRARGSRHPLRLADDPYDGELLPQAYLR